MESREIKITLETAKRWYELGDEFREIALGAFTEKEIISGRLPKTWEEFCISKGDEGIRINTALDFAYVSVRKAFTDYHDAEKHIAQMKLRLLRDEYRQGWKPDLTNIIEIKSCILNVKNEFRVMNFTTSNYFLSFESDDIAKEFLNNFRELIEQAGDLI